MTGHIRKRKTKEKTSWQIIIDRGKDQQGNRLRDYFTADSKKEAQNLLNDKLAEHHKGSYVEPSKMTLAECIEEWMKVYAVPQLAANTVRGYRVNFDHHTIPYIGNVKLQKLTPSIIQGLYGELEKKGLSARSIRYVHTTLHEVLKYAYKMQLIPKNPAEFVSVPKQSRYDAQVYDKDEVAKLLEAAKGTSMDIPIQLTVGLGLRRGELLSLQWEDVDFKEQTIFIHRNLVCIHGQYLFGEPKTKSGIRKLSVSPSLLAALNQHRIEQMKKRLQFGQGYQDHHLICCRKDGRPINPATFSSKFKEFLEEHGLRHLRLHDLRHPYVKPTTKKFCLFLRKYSDHLLQGPL